MSRCYVCGSSDFTENLVNETFEIDGKLILVENIPAKVCDRCGEIIFSGETGENIRLMLKSDRQPTRSIKVDVFAFPV